MERPAGMPDSAGRRSARILAALLLLQGIIAGLGAAASWAAGDLRPGALLDLFVLVALLSFAAALLERFRARIAEIVGTLAVALGFLLVLGAVMGSLWYIGPLLALVTIAAIFGLVERYLARDAARHLPTHE